MNCEAVQKYLLGSESPERPSPEASAHLAGCAACREWLQRLIQVETAAARLPVPRADTARSALIRRILTQAPAKKPATAEHRRPSIAIVLGSWILDPRASPRRRVGAGLVAGVAAALLLFVTVLLVRYAYHQPQVAMATPKAPPKDRLLADLDRYGIKPVETDGPIARINAMADAADQLYDHGKKDVPAGLPDTEVIALTQLYTRVLEEGILKSAEGVAPEDRTKVLQPIAARLGKANSQWFQLSQQTGLRAGVKTALQNAALAAHDGEEKLRKLCASA